jgi:glycerol-3-phosphate cytidylyltransferase-like family protein
MSNLKPMKRADLTEAINKRKGDLIKDIFMITSFRPTKDNTIQVEVCQNRLLAGKKQTLLGALNKSNAKFGNDTTLLFDWLILEPEDFKKVFPTVNITLDELKAVAAKWQPGMPSGKQAEVFAKLEIVDKVVVDGEDRTPVIIVTEVTHSELMNGDFFTGDNAAEKAENVVENGSAVMRTGSGEDAEFLVHPETGDKIYRFTRTEFKENNPKDTIIAGKMPMSQFNGGNKPATRQLDTAKLNSILDQEDGI